MALPKFYLSTSARTGPCQVVGEDHSDEMVVFRTPHGHHNIEICTRCLLEAAADQKLKGDSP